MILKLKFHFSKNFFFQNFLFLEKMKLLVLLFILKLYARINIFKIEIEEKKQ